jgi:nitric oxide synthase-interacting protein
MTRKSKQPGGHNPLTYAETKRLKSSGYGTQSTRLTTESQLPFGYCHLSTSPAVEAVATPSGHIYEREAIVQYLLTKNGELKRERKEYEKQRLEVENRRVAYEEANRKKEVERFVKKDQGAMSESSTALVVREDAAAAKNVARGTVSSTTSAAKPTKENSLKQVSYWLSEAQPMHKKGQANYDGEFDYLKEIEALPPPPSERSASPMSVQPLKLKQLIPLNLLHEGDDTKSKGTGKVLCAVSSHKQITTQLPTICIKSTGQVMLKSVYEELAKPTMVCPVTSKKFKESDVLELIKAKSGFAASGEVISKKYNPTLT